MVICGQVRFFLFSIHFSIIYLCFDSFSLLRKSVDSRADFVLLEYLYTALIRSTITPVFDGLRVLIFEKKLSFPCELKDIQYSVKVIYSFSLSVYSSLGLPIILRTQVLFHAIMSYYRLLSFIWHSLNCSACTSPV